MSKRLRFNNITKQCSQLGFVAGLPYPAWQQAKRIQHRQILVGTSAPVPLTKFSQAMIANAVDKMRGLKSSSRAAAMHP
jgi:hypothetical protein